MQFPVPSSPKTYQLVLSNFLGVDFTSILPNIRRSSYLVNMINNYGYLETRPGYAQVGGTFQVNTYDTYAAGTTYNVDDVVNYQTKDYKCILESTGNAPTDTTYWVVLNATTALTALRINGIWNMDTTTNIFIVHAKDKLYTLAEDFSNPILLTSVSNLADTRSQGVYLDNKLIIFDGKKTIVYGYFSNAWTAVYLDTVGYVPITSASREPDGTGAVAYESPNLVQPYRLNHFLGDGASATFKLDSAYDNEVPTATILKNDGTIGNLTVSSFDKDAGTVTFTTVPPASPVPGRDNVFIRFKVTNTETEDYINECSIATLYGYNGNSNRIFCTGNPTDPTVDWFSYAENPLYFPEDNFTKIGYEPNESYLRLNDGSLAIQKKTSDTDATVYYRKSALVNGQEVFPITSGVKTLGCVSRYANANLINDPMTLTEMGVYAIAGSNYGESFAVERGYFVKKRLLLEANLEEAVSIVFKGKYYLAVNNHVYIADSRYKSKVTEAYNSGFQYEWYYWDNIPVRVWLVYNDDLYFGTATGKIAKFDDALISDFGVAMTQYWDTAYLDLGSITESKTVKKVTVISKPNVESQFVLSYETVDDANTVITTELNDAETFPMVLQEKEKIKKCMFVKFRISSNVAKKMNFYQIAIEYIYSGRFRG